MKFKVGDRVKFFSTEEKGTIIEILSPKLVRLRFDSKVLLSPVDEVITNLVKLKPKTKYYYVLKTQLMDDVYPKNHEKYVKVRVVK